VRQRIPADSARQPYRSPCAFFFPCAVVCPVILFFCFFPSHLTSLFSKARHLYLNSHARPIGLILRQCNLAGFFSFETLCQRETAALRWPFDIFLFISIWAALEKIS
jgi:hypothetical protein